MFYRRRVRAIRTATLILAIVGIVLMVLCSVLAFIGQVFGLKR